MTKKFLSKPFLKHRFRVHIQCNILLERRAKRRKEMNERKREEEKKRKEEKGD